MHTEYFLPSAEIKNYKFFIYGQNFLDKPVKSDLRTIDNLEKIATGQEDDYTTGCSLDYPYFKKHKMIIIYSNKRKVLDDDPKGMQEINFTGSIDKDGNITMFFIIEETKETIFRFFTGYS